VNLGRGLTGQQSNNSEEKEGVVYDSLVLGWPSLFSLYNLRYKNEFQQAQENKLLHLILQVDLIDFPR
jgi:hypothetical protein